MLPPKLPWRQFALPLCVLTQFEYGPVGNPPGYCIPADPYVMFYRAQAHGRKNPPQLWVDPFVAPFTGHHACYTAGSVDMETLHHGEVGQGYRPSHTPIQEYRLDSGPVEHPTYPGGGIVSTQDLGNPSPCLLTFLKIPTDRLRVNIVIGDEPPEVFKTSTRFSDSPYAVKVLFSASTVVAAAACCRR